MVHTPSMLRLRCPAPLLRSLALPARPYVHFIPAIVRRQFSSTPLTEFRNLVDFHRALAEQPLEQACRMLETQIHIQPTALSYHVVICSALRGTNHSNALADALQVLLQMRALQIPAMAQTHIELIEAALCVDQHSQSARLNGVIHSPSAEHIAVAAQLVDELLKLSVGLWSAANTSDDFNLVHRLMCALSSRAEVLPLCMKVMLAIDQQRGSVPFPWLLLAWRGLASLSSTTKSSIQSDSTDSADQFDPIGARDTLWAGIVRLLSRRDRNEAVTSADYELTLESLYHCGDTDAALHLFRLMLRFHHRPSSRAMIWIVHSIHRVILQSEQNTAALQASIVDLDAVCRLIEAHQTPLSTTATLLLVRAIMDSFAVARNLNSGTVEIPFEAPFSDAPVQSVTVSSTSVASTSTISSKSTLISSLHHGASGRAPTRSDRSGSRLSAWLGKISPASSLNALSHWTAPSTRLSVEPWYLLLVQSKPVSIHGSAKIDSSRLESVVQGWLTYSQQHASTVTENMFPCQHSPFGPSSVDDIAALSLYPSIIEHPIWNGVPDAATMQSKLLHTGLSHIESSCSLRWSAWLNLLHSQTVSAASFATGTQTISIFPSAVSSALLSSLCRTLIVLFRSNVIAEMESQYRHAHKPRTALQALQARIGSASSSDSAVARCTNTVLQSCIVRLLCSFDLSWFQRGLLPLLQSIANRSVPMPLSSHSIALLVELCQLHSQTQVELLPLLSAYLSSLNSTSPIAASSTTPLTSNVSRAISSSGLKFRSPSAASAKTVSPPAAAESWSAGLSEHAKTFVTTNLGARIVL